MCLKACFEVDERIRIRKEKEQARLTEIERKKVQGQIDQTRARMVTGMRKLFAQKMKQNKVRYEAER